LLAKGNNMERQLTETEMTEIAINFLLEQLDEAVAAGNHNRVIELGESIDKMLEKLDKNTIHLKTIH
jgi:hypothetical protein